LCLLCARCACCAAQLCQLRGEADEPAHGVASALAAGGLVSHVTAQGAYTHADTGRVSGCYRVWFDRRVSNVQAKQLEQLIRAGQSQGSPTKTLALR
jgi:hypothetical protein